MLFLENLILLRLTIIYIPRLTKFYVNLISTTFKIKYSIQKKFK